MEQIKYQGYARDRGFNPIQLSTASVDAIGQQGSAVLRQMRNNQSNEVQNRGEYLSALTRKNAIEEQSRDENYQAARSGREGAQKWKQFNNQQRVDKFRIQSDAQAKSLQGLSALSGTIAKQIGEWKKDKDENEMWDEYNKAMDDGLPIERIAAQQQGEAVLDASNEKLQQVADSMQAGGAPIESVMAARRLSPARTLGRARAVSELAAAQYRPWLAENLKADDQTVFEYNGVEMTPAMAQTPDQKEAAARILRKKFMQSNGMFGMKPELIANALKQMKFGELEVLGTERQYYAISQSEEMVNEARTIFEGDMADPTRAGVGFSKYLATVARSVDRNGNVLGYAGAWNEVEKVLKEGFDAGQISPQTLEAIKNTATVDQPNKTYGQRFGWRFTKLEEELNRESIQNVQLNESQRNAEMTQEVNALREELGKGGPVSSETITALSQRFLREYGEVPDFLTTYASQMTVEAIGEKEITKEFESLAQRGALTPEMVQNPRVPFDVQQRWLGTAQQQVKAMQTTGDFKSGIEQITSALKSKIIVNTPQGEPTSYTYIGALSSAKAEFMSIVAARIKMGDDAGTAQQTALQQILPQILQAEGGKYAVDPSGSDFTGFVIKQGNGASISNARAHMAAITSKIKARGSDAIDRERLIPTQLLTEADAKRDSPQFTPPPIAQYISEMYGGQISSWDVLNRQMQAQGFAPINPPPPMQAASEIDPRFQRFLNYRTTGNRAGRALMSYGNYNPDLIPNGYGGLIGNAAKRFGVDPGLLAGLVSVESSFNKNAVSGSGAIGLGQLMPATARELGVDPNDPKQNVEGAAKYLRQMMDTFGGDLTAGLRAYNQGPGNQQRNPGGVSSEAIEYPGKVLKAAARYGFNAGGGGSVWRTSGTMNPTVANYMSRRAQLQQRNGRLQAADLGTGANNAKVNTTVVPFWNNMVAAARKAGINLSVNNSYRTFEEQANLYATKPKGMAAPPGGSNHGLGEAVDINIPNDKVFNWLSQNAKRFGFKNLPGEDWHWEFDPKLL